MEKRTPHYPLARIRTLIDAGAYRVTATAIRSAARDFGYFEVLQVAKSVRQLESRSFYKSMTTLHDSTLWQDVYRPFIEGRPAYVKVQIVDDATVVISFKALEDN